MNKKPIIKAQYTVAQYLVEVMENKVIFQPYENYQLLIDPQEFDLIKPESESEHAFFKHVIQTYVKAIQDKILEFSEFKTPDYLYKRQVNRTLNRLIYALNKHHKKNPSSANWKMIFYMPVYGIDIQRQNAEQRKLERSSEKPVNKTNTAKDLICIAYQLDNNKPCRQNPFFDLASFKKWCESKPIKGKNIKLQTILEAKLINDCVINSDDAINHITKTFQDKLKNN